MGTIDELDQPVILFDGVCNLCNGVVKFTSEKDGGKFSFAPLQSDPGKEVLQEHGMDAEDFQSFVLIEGNEIYTKSDAAVRLLKNLKGSWRYLGIVLGLVPEFLRDFGYDIVARSRYSIFGKKEECMVPDRELKERMLD